MNIVLVSSEAIPYIKTGGLADVSGSLFSELKKQIQNVHMFLPCYRGIKEYFEPAQIAGGKRVSMGDKTYYFDVFSKNGVFFISNDYFFNREGLYGDKRGDFPDNAERFAFFCMAVLKSIRDLGISPEILHLNDWQTGLIPFYKKAIFTDFALTRTVFTIHNIGYHGLFSPTVLTPLGIDRRFFTLDGFEFFGKVSLLKGGILFADKITTVSPMYAHEIRTSEYGFGLEGLLRTKDVTGILNGIDYNIWNPEKDETISQHFSKNNLAGKLSCKKELCKIFNLKSLSSPLIGMVGRIVAQKGYDLVIQSIRELIQLGVNMAILGKGDRDLENSLKSIVSRYPGRIHFQAGFDEGLARKIYAGSDMFLIPSRYEPCGLTQMISMSYGTIPIARTTGGLVDTVKDFNTSNPEGTGFTFHHADEYSLIECIKRALCFFKDTANWERITKNAMKQRFSWKDSVLKYLDLYSSLSKG